MSAIRFDDGAAYERSMGAWSRLAGEVFLDWLAPEAGQRWVDVGCGNGAFTELIVQRCAPTEVQALDPSEGQLSFARTRPGAQGAVFRQGDAQALPFEADAFDAAVMALVIFFVPDPARGVAEMARVVRPGGEVVAYAWDFVRAGFPFEPIQAELRAMGFSPPRPPHWSLITPEGLATLWAGAGLRDVELRDITVRRAYPDFETFWETSLGTASLKDIVAQLSPPDERRLRERLRDRLADAEGRIAYDALANAIRGRVPG
jgi:SAM-dependent methyltransferase